ncbi:MAG: copper amine oxidase N-terminal domain-containing protein [Candidatus Ornithomonoglobus sp.]
MKKYSLVFAVMTAIVINNFISVYANADDSQNIKVYIENQYVEFDQKPIIINERVMVPIRALFEALGYDVLWDENSKTATAINGDEKIYITANSDFISCENAATDGVPCDVVPQIVSGRMLVPVRAFAYAAGCRVYWDDNSRTVFAYRWEKVAKAYEQVLAGYETQKEWIYNSYFYPQYYFYDINKDGVPELIVDENKSELAKQMYFYTYDLENKSVVQIGSMGSGHSTLCSMPNQNGVMKFEANMGIESFYTITINNNQLSIIPIIEGKDCYYTDYDTPDAIVADSEYLDCYDVVDTSGIYLYYL